MGYVVTVSVVVISALFGLRLSQWKQRRHDYGQLLIAIGEGSRKELLKRIDLVLLIASQKLREKVEAISIDIRTKKLSDEEISQGDRKKWRDDLLERMQRDMSRWL